MELCTDYELMFENIVQRGTEYLKKYPHIKGMVVGLSGGIDSALTAAIAREICDRGTGLKLIGISIPIESNKQIEIDNARRVGKAFCHEFKEVRFINKLFKLFRLLKGRPRSHEEKVRRGNIKARLRMIYLYDKAHRNNSIVLSTDNLTEFNLGFWTLHGDVGDFGLIQSLWKTEVYGMSMYLCQNNVGDKMDALMYAIRAVPTDGLGVSTSDYDQLGVSSYRAADNVLIYYINGADIRTHPIIKRHLKYAFKRENPYNIPREKIIL